MKRKLEIINKLQNQNNNHVRITKIVQTKYPNETNYLRN